MTRPKVLALSFFPAYVPPENGGVERLLRIYSYLADRFDVTLVSSGEVGGARQIIEHSATFTEIRVPKDAYFEDCYVELTKHSKDGDLSGPALGISNRRFGQLHDVYLEHYSQCDFIIHDSPFLIHCDLFRGFDSKVRVYNSYNFETGLYRSFHSSVDDDNYIEAVVEELERDLCLHADLITVCAQADLTAFSENFQPAAPIEIVPNGFVPSLAASAIQRVENRILFLGSNHKPNADAARRIVKELAPALPQYEFHLIGSCHPKLRSKNVIAHGIVDRTTKDELLSSATVAINPMESGSGSSLKIADIAQHGLPLISTELGARGFNLESNVHFLALDPNDLVNSVQNALASTDLAGIADAARRQVTENFSWQSIAHHFADRLMVLKPRNPVTPYLVVNDYDSLAATGGGATRTSGLCGGLAERSPVIFMAYANEASDVRRVSEQGRVLSLLVQKTSVHLAEHEVDNALHWISTADIVNGLQAASNSRLVNTFRTAASISQQVICEHPYMTELPRMFGVDFVYSSQNFEFGMKAEALSVHPRAEDRIAAVRQFEEFACGASSMIIAVSEEDATRFGATYRFTAPTVIIPNGADGPADGKLRRRNQAVSRKRRAIFMGSAHGPNVEAARWIVKHLAPSMPELEFELLGSIADCLTDPVPNNVKLVGQVSRKEKSRRLYRATLALNPVISGSGSNVKVADYLQHGLPVISTAFGSRGYASVATSDLRVAELSEFASSIANLLASPAVRPASCVSRQFKYLESLSMKEGGRMLAEAIDEHSGNRPRALYVTYRYMNPPRGGGEYYVDRLMGALAENGWMVDVVSPDLNQIVDVHRFGVKFEANERAIKPGLKRVRSAKFPLDQVSDHSRIAAIWRCQPAYEEIYLKRLPGRPAKPAIAWGWTYPQDDGRWLLRDCGLFAPSPASLTIRGQARIPTWLRILSDAGELIYDEKIEGKFNIRCAVPAGFVRLQSTLLLPPDWEDPRPLTIFANCVELNGEDIICQSIQDIWTENAAPEEVYEAQAVARREVRDAMGLRITDLRRPSTKLSEFLKSNIDQYDLLVTHNAIFETTNCGVSLAKDVGVPSIVVPHLHLEDDFYHFSDIMDACRDATVTLACPKAAQKFLVGEGIDNARFFTPGIDANESFSAADAAAFRKALGCDDDFILILGRKAMAKGYLDVIRSAQEMGSNAPLVVMIGPDDDHRPLRESGVVYLGPQPRPIVRGALMECLALVNMSRSESFGIVLLEAGLAGKPVVANRGCAAFLDLVEDGVNGYLTTPEQLGECLALLVGNEKTRKRMGDAGRQMAQVFDWCRLEREFVGLSDSLAGRAA